MVIVLILLFGLIAWVEVLAMRVHRLHREMRVFWPVLVLSFLYCLGAALEWQWLSPTPLIVYLFGPIAKWTGMQ